MEKKTNNKYHFGSYSGSIIYRGVKVSLPVEITYVEFDENNFKKESFLETNTFYIHESNLSKVQWYDIRGLHNLELISKIGERFQMHPLALEDALNVYSRPSYQEYPEGHFFTCKIMQFDADKKLQRHHLSLFFGRGFLITFHESDGPIFQNLIERIEKSQGRVRGRNADYLAYAVLDIVTDNYYKVIEKIESRIERLETTISTAVSGNEKAKIFKLKKELLRIRKSVAPLREAMNTFSRVDSNLIDKRTEFFLRDVYDKSIHILDNLDTLREMINSIQELYHSEINMEMNKIIQFLTIITAVFVPISFLAGLYGMNFTNMPELNTSYGYFVLLGFMASIVISLLFYFKKKKWL